MGQLFCKDCCHDNIPGTKKGAFITWGADTTLQQQNDDDDYDEHDNIYISASTEDDYDDNHNNTNNNDHRKRQSKRVRHKKRNVALHAEFRDRFYAAGSTTTSGMMMGASSSAASSSVASESTNAANNNAASAVFDNNSNNNNNDILAPPLCNAKVMVETDNVFCGVECGVDTLLISPRCSSSSDISSMQQTDSTSFDGGGGDTNCNDDGGGRILPQDNSTAAAARHAKDPPSPPKTFPKTPEEEIFLTSALTDTDTNFILDGIPPHLRQTLMSQMERITVPQHHLLIRKGDPADYFYLLYKGEIGVYIDPGECMDDDVIDIKMIHSNHNSNANLNKLMGTTTTGTGDAKSSSMSPSSGGSDRTTTTIKRNEFQQSYVLNLRKSLFQSAYNDNTNGINNHGNNTILGQVISLVRGSFGTDEKDDQVTAGGGGRGGGGGAAEQITPPAGSSSATATTAASSTLPALIEEMASSTSCDEETDEVSFTPLTELQRLRHERDLGPMDVFGELALIYNCPRTASCVTSTPCTLYRVDGEIFKSILSSSNADREKMRCTESKAALEALHNLGVMENWLDEKSLRDLDSVLNPITFHRGDMVMTKGDYDKIFFFVMSGKLLAHDVGTGDSRKVDLELVEGNHFGELNLLANRPSVANVTVISPKVRLMAITKKDYNKRRASLEPLMRKLSQRNALLTIPVIAKSKLLPNEINKLVQKLELVTFPRGTVAFTSEEMKSALYIMVKGKMQLIISDEDHGVVNTFEVPDHFGGRSLLDPKFFLSKNVQLRALVEGTECVMLSRKSILEVIGKINRLGTPTVPVSRKLVKNMKRSDLKLHRIIGVGAFGRVWLASHRARKTVYALKVMDKKEIVAKKMTKGVMREKNVLASVEHPFIVGLISTFQDDYRVYMLQHYVQGGELLGLIYNVSKKGYLSNDAAAFYGACIVEALSHLHSRSIVHRDLKPENILINAAGYVVLADFGFAKVVLDKTYTTCGSPEYMSPEMLLGKGHNWSVDHWALGVVLYEMLVGQTPFIHVGATRMTLFRRICRGKIAFPNSKKHGIDVHPDARQLIAALLTKDIAARLGSSITQGEEPLRTNPWFQGLLTDYHHVFLAEKVSPPWFPDVDNELDTSYFESHDELEKELLSKEKKETPLDRKSQRMFQGF
mmetsp:Transcript_9485/g.19063  ORF Transcript_9485/g.19063 Transcript_9485/m.19063 type:complete len:1156 (+) Transcript_9485:260-3727(+)